MKLVNYVPTEECLNNHQISQKLYFSFFFIITLKVQKMADPILKSSLKTRLNTNYCDIFSFKIKKVDKFQLCPKKLQVVFPLAA